MCLQVLSAESDISDWCFSPGVPSHAIKLVHNSPRSWQPTTEQLTSVKPRFDKNLKAIGIHLVAR